MIVRREENGQRRREQEGKNGRPAGEKRAQGFHVDQEGLFAGAVSGPHLPERSSSICPLAGIRRLDLSPDGATIRIRRKKLVENCQRRASAFSPPSPFSCCSGIEGFACFNRENTGVFCGSARNSPSRAGLSLCVNNLRRFLFFRKQAPDLLKQEQIQEYQDRNRNECFT